MDSETIFRALAEWNIWEKDIESGLERRNYLDRALRYLDAGQVVSVIGVRRAGKSTILKQMVKRIAGSSGARNTLVINLEDVHFSGFDVKLLQKTFEVYLKKVRPTSRPTVFVDEVHRVPGWERWARTLHELDKARIVVSGSTSELLSRELGTVLTGRHLDVSVFPLSFLELLFFRGLEIGDELSVVQNRVRIEGLAMEYMEAGGFPEVVRKGYSRELLGTYFEDILHRDIIHRYSLRKTEALRKLARFVLTNISSLHTHRSAARFLGVSPVTAERYYRYFEEVFLIFPVKRFSFSVKEQESAPRKIYSIDTGLSNAVGFRFSENRGKLAENIVALQFRRMLTENPLLELYHWRDQYGKEVDFVLKDGERVTELVQVCWNMDDPETRKRELRSLLKAMRLFGLKKGLVITEELEDVESMKGRKIIYRPLWKWLLGDTKPGAAPSRAPGA